MSVVRARRHQPVAFTVVPGPGRVVFFGTYDERRHPRVAVLREGLVAHGYDVQVVNVPLDLDTAARVQLVSQPWRAPLAAVRLVAAWARLLVRSRAVHRPDVVVVGYLGHLDVHLARLRWRRAHLVVDHMVSLADTVVDRGIDGSSLVTRVLRWADRAATGRADTVVVDTAGQAAQLPPAHRRKTVVVPVGAPQAWFDAARPVAYAREIDAPAGGTGTLSVVFFGLYTPLQGTVTIGEAVAKLEGEPVAWTMVGTGQNRPACEAAAAGAAVRWLDWVDAVELPALVAAHDVCLGIFGTGPKAQRVVPNKVFQGAAAGCVIVTSDTAIQRQTLGEAAIFVPAGDAAALSEVIKNLSKDLSGVASRRRAARSAAEQRFTPSVIVDGLIPHLGARDDAGRGEARKRRSTPPLSPSAALRWHVVRRVVDAVQPGTILELGAGQGAVGSRLATLADYVGVEPDPVSRKTAERRLPGGTRMIADLHELTSRETFEMACAFEVLEHIEDDAQALVAWADHIQPGGHLLVSVPAGPERFGPADELVGHVRRYTSDGLSALFSAAGLETVSIEHYGYPLSLLLEAGRNAIARRRLDTQAGPSDIASRTAGSGRLLQPPGWAGSAIWAATAPFRVAQRRFPQRGPGLVGLARRPG
jgi:glycosyltransferase involved in cell wall biosynthesis